MSKRVATAARLLLATTLLTGCSTLTGAVAGGRIMPLQGGAPVPLNPSEGQVVASGTVRDPQDRPVAGAVVFLVLGATQAQNAELEVGDTVPEVPLLAVTTGADGAFAIRLGAHPDVLANAEADGGFANFALTAVERWPSDDPGGMGFWWFPLTVTGSGYADLPGPITIELGGG